MTKTTNDINITERMASHLQQISDYLLNFSQEFAETHELVKKAVENTLPILLDKEMLCRKLNITERTLYRHIKDYNVPVHKLGNRLYFYWNEVEESLSQKKK